MRVIDRLLGRKPVPETKVSRAAPLLALYGQGRPLWSERETRTLAEAGYRRNAVAHRCVKLVTDAASSLPMTLHDGAVEATSHPLLDLLARPNPRQAGGAFLESVYGHLLMAGNAYLELVRVDDVPRELYALRPDRMRVVPGPEGWPEAYDYTVGGRSVRYGQTGPTPPILHLTMFDPLDDWYGFPPLAAAQTALDLHNAASAWHKALLDNSARPSGALVYAADGANLSEEQYARLKDELERNFQGAANAGRPILLEGGLDWKPLSLSPKDVEFLEAKNAAAREIALAFGVPPLLLGLPGDNTHANYAEANRAFWRSTVIPLATRVAESVTQWLSPSVGRRAAAGARSRPGGGAGRRAGEPVDEGGRGGLPHRRREAGRRGVRGETRAGASVQRQTRPERRAVHVRARLAETGRGPGRDRAGRHSRGGSGRERPAALPGRLAGGRGKGGHTISEHIGRSDEQLRAAVREIALVMRTLASNRSFSNLISGSFPSIEAAQKLVNSTLAQNGTRIDEFLAGSERRVVVSSPFGSLTGREAYAASPYAEPRSRDTFGAAAGLLRDRSSRGYTV